MDTSSDTPTPRVWSVPLPAGAEPPYEVFVNGLPQREGEDYAVEGRWLRFSRALQPKVAMGFRRRISLLMGVGVYNDLTADVVDLQYRVGGGVRSESGLPIIPPQDPLGAE